MRNRGPLKLNIRDKALREDLEGAIFTQMLAAIGGAKQRNDDLREMDDQFQMLSGISGTNPWRDSASVNDTLTFDQGLTITAMMSQAVQRDPKALVEAPRKSDEEGAKTLEYYLTTKHYEAGFNRHLDHLGYNCARWPYAILYDGWREDKETVRYTGYRDPENGLIVEEEQKRDGLEYDEIPMTKPGFVTYAGLDMRVVDSPDFYLYPADAITIESADAVGEMMLLTRHGLLDGIDNLGLDEEAVHELLSRGPAGEDTGDYRETRNRRDGVESQEEDYYEILVWYTRLPLLYDAEHKLRTPDYLLHDEILCIACPGRRRMLRMDFSPYANTRPYIRYCMLDIPNAFQGWCIPKMLDGLQAEANAELQMGINVMNLELMPMFKAPETQRKYLENQQASPGKIFYYMGNDPNALQPLYLPNTLRGNQESLALLNNKGEKTISAGGFGTYQSKQRKNAETQAVQQAAFTKFDHYLSNFQRGIKDTYLHSAALLANWMDDDGEDFTDPFDHNRHITPQMLKSRYIIRPAANSTNTDPNTRVEMARELQEAVQPYLALLDPKLQTPPKVLKLYWHTTRELILALGKHDPEAYIGEEPDDTEQPAQQPTTPGLNYTPMNMGANNGNGTGNPSASMGLPTG